MRTSIAVINALLFGVEGLKLENEPRLNQKRFATGMNGDEDLGLDMVV
jgi:hypothetical protein